MEELLASGGSRQAVVESLLGRQKVWWGRCQEAVREDPGWLLDSRSAMIRRWLIATAANGSGHATGSVRGAVDSAYLVSQALTGKRDSQHAAGLLAQVGQQWDQSGLLLPPLGTGLVAGHTAQVGDVARVLATLSAQHGNLRAVSEPARAAVALTAMLLAGAEPLTRHGETVSVVFGWADDHGRNPGQESGAAGHLKLYEFPAGPAGLFPDPRWMAGAQAVNSDFADALDVAWRYSGGNRCVLWRIVLPDDPAWIPVLSGNSLGAAFTLGLLELLRYRGSRWPALASARKAVYRLRPATALTGRIDDQGGLHWVGDMEAKLRAAHQYRWLLIAPEENREDLRQAPDPRLVKPAATIIQASRYAHQRRTGRIAIAAALAAILAITATLLVRANTQTDYQRDSAISENLASTSESLDGTDPVLARLLAVAAWRVSPSDQTARQARQAMLDAAANPAIRIFGSQANSINAVAFSPDGKTLAEGTGKSGIRLWNTISGQPVSTLARASHTGTAYAVAFSPNGKTLAAGGSNANGDGQLQLWNTTTGQPIRTLLVPPPLPIYIGGVSATTFSPDGKIVAAGTGNGQVELWDTAAGEPVRGWLAASYATDITSLAFSPGGKILASGDGEGNVRLWNAATGRLIATLPSHLSAVDSVAFRPDGKILATSGDTANDNSQTQLWNTDTWKPIGTSLATAGSLAFSPDGATLAVSDDTAGTQLWNIATAQLISTLPAAATGAVGWAAFSPNGRALASVGIDGEIQIWNTEAVQPRIISPTASYSGPIDTLAFSPDGTVLAGGDQDGEGSDGRVQLWNTVTGRTIGTPLTVSPDNPVNSVAFSPDGKILAATGTNAHGDGEIQLWNVATRRLAGTVPASPRGEVLWLAFTPDGKVLAAADNDDEVTLWSTATWKLIGTLKTTSAAGEVFSMAFSPDGKSLVAGTANGQVFLWDVPTRQLIRTLLASPSGVGTSVAFSPDGETVAIGSGKDDLQLWNTRTGDLTGIPLTATSQILSVAFSPNGSTLATAQNGQLQLWNTATGQSIGGPLPDSPSEEVSTVAFSPDGKTIVEGSEEGSVQLWNVSYLDNVVPYLCTLAGRSLTRGEWAHYASGAAYSPACP